MKSSAEAKHSVRKPSDFINRSRDFRTHGSSSTIAIKEAWGLDLISSSDRDRDIQRISEASPPVNSEFPALANCELI
jgi:hypothetical protein